MAYTRSKSKTSRRVKRAKTNKRNSARKQIFRKSRRVNRGGKTPQKRSREGYGDERPVKYIREDYVPGSMEEKMLQNKENDSTDAHNKAQIEHEKIKDAEIEEKKIINMRSNRYREPLYPGNTEVVHVNQTPYDNLNEQYKLDPDAPEFGGKKKRATRRK
jgi:hypothetical protein